MLAQLGDSATDALVNGEWPTWAGEAYGASGLGVSGTALFVLFIGAIGLANWSESFKVPAVWLVLMTPVLAVTLPAPVTMRLMGVVTTALAALFVGFWLYWRRM